MNKHFKLLLILFSMIISLNSVGQTTKQLDNYIKFMSYDLNEFSQSSSITKYEELGGLIRKERADFVALQNVPCSESELSDSVLKQIALESRMFPVLGPAQESQTLAILSTEKPINTRLVQLPVDGKQNVMMIAEYKRLVFVSLNLAVSDEQKSQCLPIILKEVQSLDKPFVLAGNWNSNKQQDIAVYCSDKESFVKRFEKVIKVPFSSQKPLSLGVQFLVPEDEMFAFPPYLQNPRNDGMTIMAQTSCIAECWVEYGLDTLNLQKVRTYYAGQVVCHDIEHKFHLNGLKEGESYFYRVCAKEIVESQAYHKTFGKTGKTQWHKFTLPRKNSNDFTAIIVNDLHDYKSTIDILSNLASQISYDFVICNGDCLPEPSNRNHAMRMIATLNNAFNGQDHPMFFIRGNHEIRNAYSSGMSSLIENPGGKEYGAFNWGDTRFVFLDCGEDKPDDFWVYYGLNDFNQFRMEQIDFLKQEIRSKEFKKSKMRILVNHIPIWGNSGDYQPCTELWAKVLSKAPFDVNFAAHMHRMKYYKTGEISNPFPVIVGGGPQYEHARLIILEKKSDDLFVKVLNTKGQTVLSLEF